MNKRILSAIPLLLQALPALGGETWVARFTGLYGKPTTAMAQALGALDRLNAQLPVAATDFENVAIRVGVSPNRTLIVTPVSLDGTALPGTRSYAQLSSRAPTGTARLLREAGLRGCGEALIISETMRTAEKPRAITSSFKTPFPGVAVEMRARLLDGAGRIRGERTWRSRVVARSEAEIDDAIDRTVKGDAEREAGALLKDLPLVPQQIGLRIEAPEGGVENLEWIKIAGGSVETPQGSDAGTFLAVHRQGLGALLDAAAATGRYRLTSFNPVTLQRR